MGNNAFALMLNMDLVEVGNFFLAANGEPMVEAWWDNPDEGQFMMALPLSEIRVMA